MADLATRLAVVLARHHTCPCGCTNCSCPDHEPGLAWSEHVAHAVLPLVEAEVGERVRVALDAVEQALLNPNTIGATPAARARIKEIIAAHRERLGRGES